MNGWVCGINIEDSSVVSQMAQSLRLDADSPLEPNVFVSNGAIFYALPSRNGLERVEIASSPEGVLSIFYNGHLTNAQRLRQHVKPKPKDNKDSSLILSLYKLRQRKCVHYLEGSFAFVIKDKDGFYAARDPLGAEPLYFTRRGDGWLFATQMKAFLTESRRIAELPPGCYLDSRVGARRYFQIPHPVNASLNPQEVADLVGALVLDAVQKALKSDLEVGVYLTGSVESCIIAAIAAQKNRRIKTFSVGLAESQDGHTARKVAAWLGADHTHVEVTEQEILENLSKIIHTLESFDAPLVRHAVADYFALKKASESVQVIVSGDAANELFGGYPYLRPMFTEKLSAEIHAITQNLHRTHLLRWNRMTNAFGLEGRTPFIDRRLAHTVSRLPSNMKVSEDGRSKWCLRRAFSTQLPAWVVDRPDSDDTMFTCIQEVLKNYAETVFTDEDLKSHNAREKEGYPNVRTKDELLYFQIWNSKYPLEYVPLVGRTVM